MTYHASTYFLLIIICVYYQHGATLPCTNCSGVDVTCVDGVCLHRCVNVTSSGECLQCRDSRFYGKQCENVCPDACINSTCQLINSRVVCMKGCVAGMKGDNCGVKCLEGCKTCERYGDNCTGSCKEGYYGTLCENKCSTNCKDNCQKDDGSCHGCKPCYKGKYCDDPCLTPCPDCQHTDGCKERCRNVTFGPACTTPCPQNCNVCDKEIGDCITCKSGYTGICCYAKVTETSDVTTPQTSPGEGGPSETLKIVCAVLGTLLCTAAILFIYKKCSKHFPVRNRKIHENISNRRSKVTDSRYSTGHSASSQYMTGKYWEIKDEDLDSSTEEVHAPPGYEVLLNGGNNPEQPPSPDQPSLLQNISSQGLRADCYPHNLPNKSLSGAFKMDEIKPLFVSKKRSSSWTCPSKSITVSCPPRPHSDSSASGKTFRGQCSDSGSGQDGSCDISKLTVQYLTPNTVEIT